MRMKRFLAGFLCLCMVGTMDMPYVQAAAVAAKSEPVAQESAKQDAEDANRVKMWKTRTMTSDQKLQNKQRLSQTPRQQNRQRVQEAQRTRQSRPHC